MPYDQALAQNKQVAAYAWEVEKNGVITASEFDVNGVDQPLTTAFARQDLPDGDALFTAEHDLLFRARPQRDELPVVELKLEAGMSLIWKHRVVKQIGVFGGETREIHFQTLIVGRRRTDGREEVMQVWPNGEKHEFDSFDEAMKTI